jgi:pimeloyl-ACP methyl ester carboxylesterase
MYAFNIELARRNFTVVSVDLAGHGDSDVLFEWDNYNRLADDCYAALEYVWSTYANTNPGLYGVIGHSLGWHVGLAMYNQLTQPGALVAIGPVWIETAAFIPTNTLLASGQYDELIPAGRLLTEFQSIIGNSSAEAGITYGNLTEGTAYRLILAPSNHITEVTDRLIVIESATWMIQALQGEDQLAHTREFWRPYFRTYDLVYGNRAVAYSVGAFSLLASLIPLLLILAEHLPKRIAPQPIQYEALRLKKKPAALVSFVLGALMITSYGSTGYISQALGDPDVLWLNSYNALGLAAFFLIWPTVLVLLLIFNLKESRMRHLLEGIGYESDHSTAILKTSARAIIPTLVCIIWLIVWMSLGSQQESQGTIIILPVLRIPIDQRLMGILVLMIFAFPFSVADALWSELLLQDTEWDGIRLQVKEMGFCFIMRLVPMAVFALVMVYGSVFLGIVAGPSVVLGLLLLYFVIASTAATFILFFTKIGFKNPWPAVFVNALLYAWIIVNAMPLV